MADLIEYVSNAAALDYFISNSGINSGLDKSVLQSAVEDAVRKMRCSKMNKHRVAVLLVEDHAVRLPEGISKINHVAFRPLIEDCPRMTKQSLHEAVNGRLHYHGHGYATIPGKCHRCSKDPCHCDYPEIEIDLLGESRQLLPGLYKESHGRFAAGHASIIDLPGNRGHDRRHSPYHNQFRIIKPAQHSGFNADFYVRGCLNLDPQIMADNVTEFKIEMPYLNINQKDGELLISYFGRPIDDEGMSLVPNIPEVFEYLEEYMTARYFRRLGMRNRDRGMMQEAKEAKSRADRLLEVAKGIIDTPTFSEWWSFLENNFTKMVPYYESYQEWGRNKPDHNRNFYNRLHNY